MKNAWIVALLVAAGCSSSPEPSTQPNPPAQPALSPKEQQIGTLRAQIAAKRAEVGRLDSELLQIAAEREDWNTKGASDEKTNRLIALGQAENDINRKRAVLNSDLASFQQQLQDLVGGPRPRSADEALDSALEADAKREAELATGRKVKEEAARSDEARKVAAAEAARIAEEQARKKEIVKGGRVGETGADGPLFEERWADVILKLRIELQKYKRW